MPTMLQNRIDELAANVAVARKRELAFGFCIGKSPETSLLVCHKTKDPEALGRQAKKDGETAKIAFGTMLCQGKDLQFSCQGEVPSGLARKAKEMFKAAGLKFKVAILDAEGNLLDSDGDEDEEGPAVAGDAPEAEDPERAKWVEASDRIRPHVEEALALGGPLANKLRAVWTFALDKASGDKPDYTVAIKSVGMLVKLVGEVTRAAGAPVPEMEMAAGEGGPSAAADPAPVGGAAPAPAGAAPAPAGAAPADAAGDGPGAGGAAADPAAPAAPQKPDLTGTDAEKLTRAEADLVKLKDLSAAFLVLLPGAAPAAWATEIARITPILTAMKAPGAPDAKKLDTALKDMTTLANTIRAKSTEAAQWKKAHDLIGIRLLTLDHHAQSAQPEVQPQIVAVKAKVTAAEALAAKLDFRGAIAALAPLAAKCDEVEGRADGCAHYKAVLADRQGLVAAGAGAPTGIAAVDTLQTQIKQLLDKAALDATAGKFDDGVKKLDQIPPLHEKRLVLLQKKADYDTYIIKFDAEFALINAMPAPERTLMEPGLAKYRKAYADAKVAVTRDYTHSAAQMYLLELKEFPYYQGVRIAVGAYVADLRDFETEYNKIKPHAGRAGIEKFYLAMDADYTAAKNEAAANKHATGSALLNRTRLDWPLQLALADDYLIYTSRLAVLKPLLDALRPKPAAATALAQADALLATAAKQSLAGDHTAAVVSLVEAEKRQVDAKAAADAQDALGGLKNTAALDGMAADFAAAQKVYADMRANVVTRDTTGGFAAAIAAADTPAAAAATEAGKAPPNFANARTKLDEAIALLEGVLPKIMAFVPWQAHLATAKTLIDTTLPGVNTDSCINGQITDAKRLMTEAEALAAAPGLDIAGAEAKLTQAMTIAEAAQADATLYGTVKTDVVAIDAVKAVIAGAGPLVPMLAARNTELDTIKTEVTRLIGVRDMKGAAAKAREGAGYANPITQDILFGTGVLARKKVWYDDKLPTVSGPGNEVCLPLVTAAAPKYAAFLLDLNAGKFNIAFETIRPPAVDLTKAQVLLKAHNTYEPKRVAAEAKLALVKAVRNAGIETDLVALEKRYTDAVALAAAGTLARAEAEMVAIEPLCQPLIDRANAFKPYEDARVPARTRLDEALAHAKAAAIQPMLTRLTAKYDAAVKLATGGDYATAKTMMVELLADAEKAIQSADDSANLALVTDTLDAAADTGFLPAAVIAATQLVLDRLKARPEAASANADLTIADTEMAKARAGGGGAKAALKAAIAACEKADEVMSQHRMLEQSVKRAKDLIAALNAHPQKAYVAGLLAPVDASVNGALAAATASGDHAAATATLEADFVKLQAMQALADGYAKYLTTRAEPQVEPQLDVLEKHAHRYAVKPAIDTMRAKLAEAASCVGNQKVEDALKLLEEVRTIGKSALMMADMRDNKAPTIAEVKELLARPGGTAELDAMIDNLDPSAQGPVLRVAFEARFGCKLQVVDAAGNPAPDDPKNLRRYYDLMSQLPPGHASGNDSLLIFTEKGGGGSLYRGTTKEVVMNEGQDAFSGEYGFGREFEVGGQDDACKPTDTKPVTRFSWNTLHEVGHAVDDKHGFMAKNGSGATYGGWVKHGGAVGPVAQIFADHFKYDRVYIEKYMLHNPTPQLPPPVAGTTPEDWESRRIAVTSHIDLAFSSRKPWNSNAQAARLTIGGKVYQESYDNDWHSYDAGARQQGMTGYQFRAPGEWFAELYAAYHIGKMKPAHPAMAWVAAL